MELIAFAQGVNGEEGPQARRLKESIKFLENRLEEIKQQTFGKSAEAQRTFIQIQLSTTYSALLNKQMELIVLVEGVNGEEGPQARCLQESIAFLENRLEKIKQQDQEAAINSLIDSIPGDEATRFIFSASKDSAKVLFDALEREKQITILTRPVIRTLDNELAILFLGTKEQNLFIGIVPQIQGDRIQATIKLARNIDDQILQDQSMTWWDKEVPLILSEWILKEDISTVVGGVRFNPDGSETGKELLLCITPRIVPPKDQEKSLVTAYFLKYADPATAFKVLQTTFADTPDVRLALDPKTNDLIVYGTESVHEKVLEVLKVLDTEPKPK